MTRKTLDETTALCRLLGDATRLRLLSVLQHDALGVAELTEVTGLAQSRVSTHLARLREAGLVADAGDNRYAYDGEQAVRKAGPVWKSLLAGLDDPQLAADRERAAEVVRRRQQQTGWAESVAGRMERHYSPGRSWEATALALIGLLELGDVIDIASGDGVLAELLAHRARSVLCVDSNAAVVQAGQTRLAGQGHVRFARGDMHSLDADDASFDQAFLMHALTYPDRPEAVVREAARVLRPGGTLVMATLARHQHEATTELYDHVNLGFDQDQIRALLTGAGLQVKDCRSGAREPRPPYFEVIVALGRKA